MRSVIAGFSGAMLVACSPADGTMLEITGTLQPTNQCVFSGTNLTVDNQYDPTGSNRYLLVYRVSNHLETREEAPISGAVGENIRPETNNVSVTGFETCFYLQSEVADIGSFDQGPIDCNSLPETQRRFVLSTGGVPAGGTANIPALVLSHEDLQGLFGPAFDPTALPLGISTPVPLTANEGEIYNPSTESPRSSSRSAAWGTYPESREAFVVLQVRAVGQLLSGRVIYSNWFVRAVTVCMGCVLLDCGVLQAAPCSVDATTSAVTYGFEGFLPNLNGVCDPFSGYGRAACDEVTCP